MEAFTYLGKLDGCFLLLCFVPLFLFPTSIPSSSPFSVLLSSLFPSLPSLLPLSLLSSLYFLHSHRFFPLLCFVPISFFRLLPFFLRSNLCFVPLSFFHLFPSLLLPSSFFPISFPCLLILYVAQVIIYRADYLGTPVAGE